MSRTAKQLLYGALYLGFLVLIAIGLFPDGESARVAPTPASQDLIPLVVRGPVTAMTAADGSVAFLARVRNQNALHIASAFPYSFRILRDDGTSIETVSRVGFVYPSETSAFLETVPSAAFMPTTSSTRDSGAIGAEEMIVELVLGMPTWTDAEFSLRPVLTLVRSETSSDENGLVVRGEVKNTGVVTAAVARIIALVKDANGFPLFAAQTLLSDVPREASREFFIRFPRDEGISARAAAEQTELIVEAR